jgi:hypothetical protein
MSECPHGRPAHIDCLWCKKDHDKLLEAGKLQLRIDRAISLLQQPSISWKAKTDGNEAETLPLVSEEAPLC